MQLEDAQRKICKLGGLIRYNTAILAHLKPLTCNRESRYGNGAWGGFVVASAHVRVCGSE